MLKYTTRELFDRHQSAKTPDLLAKTIVCLHNIRSNYNVGSVFRNADAFGIQEIYLSGFTPTPPSTEISKTAIGAENNVRWKSFGDWEECYQALQKKSAYLVGVEQTKAAIPLNSFQPNHRDMSALAYVFGNEVKGLEEEVLAQCNEQVIIPQFGEKHSLNISVSNGIVLYHTLAISSLKQ